MMNRFYFECEDEEVIKFLKSLKRKRSAVIVELVRNLMEESDEFLPGYIMAKTGCMTQVNLGSSKRRTYIKEPESVETIKEDKPKTAYADVALAGLKGFGL